jgi:hypothetical protein
VVHPLADILRARILAIACGYEDADDLDHLRRDPGFKLAYGRLPDTGRDLCSQPTMSRWENAPSLHEVIRLMRAMVDLYCASYPRPPAAVTLDIDDTVDVVHGRQQLSLFNAHYDERCFLPIHVYDTATARPVMVLLRPGKTPSGQEIRGHLRRLVRQLRRHWPRTHITLRGDGHGTVKLLTLGRASWQIAAATERQSSRRGNLADIGPHLERTRPCGSILTGGDVVTAKMEEVGNLVVGRQETLCLAC